MSDVRMKHSERSEDDLRAEGGKTKHRYAKGGKVPKIKINIHGGPHVHFGMPTPHLGGIGPGTGGGPPQPPAGAMTGSPPSLGGLPPASAMPGMPPPMRKHGGRIKSDYGPSDVPQTDISSYRAAKNQGGPVKAGANTGVSRKIEYEKLKGKN
jgi:hypothetical protein